jgi:hypothetical protein
MQVQAMIRSFALAVLTILLSIGALLYFWPFLGLEPQQDKCSFGPVSNAKYLALLASAKSHINEHGKIPIGHDLRPWLKKSLSGFVSKHPSTAERIAATHALLRASNGILVGGWHTQGEPTMSLRYVFDLNRHGFHRLIFRWPYVTLKVGPSDPVEFYVFHTHFIEGQHGVWGPTSVPDCPPVPSG